VLRRQNNVRRFAFITALALILAACGSDSAGQAAHLDGDWLLIEGSLDGAALTQPPDHRVTMNVEGSQIDGRAACNSYGGAVRTEGGSFSIDELAWTAMACQPDVMALESEFLEALGRADSWTRADTEAILTGTGTELVFRIVDPVPDAALIGPTWVLATMLEGDVARSIEADADPALLRFEDETFSGSTGCRTLSGDYVISGDVVQLTSFGAEGDCSPSLTDQDSRIISVLEAGFTATIDGVSLTLRGPGGEGLVYRTG